MGTDEKVPRKQAARTYGPYSAVREAGGFVFVASQVGVDPATGMAPAGVRAQTAQALHNVQAALAAEGLSWRDVVDVTVFLTNMDDFGAMNDIYGAYCKPPYPARACVAASGLPRVGGDVPIVVEIKAIAARPS